MNFHCIRSSFGFQSVNSAYIANTFPLTISHQIRAMFVRNIEHDQCCGSHTVIDAFPYAHNKLNAVGLQDKLSGTRSKYGNYTKEISHTDL